jgi:hypothetical protein
MGESQARFRFNFAMTLKELHRFDVEIEGVARMEAGIARAVRCS